MTEKYLLKVEEAAELLSIGRSHVYELIASGELETVKIGRSRRVRPTALQELIARHEVEPETAGARG